MLLFNTFELPDNIFIASKHVEAAIIAFVEAIAGMTFLITPSVNWYVTPWIPKESARFKAFSYIQVTSSIESLSTALWKCFFHSIMYIYSMQCSGSLGVSAIVHRAKAP